MQVAEFKVPGPSLKLAPIGDIQYGSQGCDKDKLRRHIKWGNKRGWHYLGMGDYLDPGSPSTRAKVEAAGFYESMREMIDDGICRLADDLAESLQGNWLGMIEGDHRLDLSDGEPIDHYLSQAVGTPFLGTSAFIRVKIGDCPKELTIWAYHGRLSSSTNPTGLTLEFARKQAAFDADIYLMGHAHQKYAVPRDVLLPVKYRGKWHIAHRDVVYAATGSFLNGWAYESASPAGYPRGGYVEQHGLTPTPTGAPLITITPVQREWGWSFEIRSSV